MKTKEKGVQNQSDVYFVSPSNLALNTFLYVTCVGHFFYEDDYHLWRENYNSYLCMYLVKGKARIMSGEQAYLAKQGDFVYLDCYKPHGYEAVSDLETIWFHFDGVGAKQINAALQELDTVVFTLSDNTRAVHCMKQIYENYCRRNPRSEPVISSVIMAVLAELFPSSQTRVNNKSMVEADIMEQTFEYVRQHLSDELTLEVLATQASLSKFYFSRVFKKETGFTPHEYVCKARLNYAKELLRGTDCILRQIAHQCGFPDESSFSAAFKKNVGLTPGEFRRMKL
ncbi:MAG: AraC family transcriptional regulator [Acetatifactor sp.]|nr:AraC family transcriptional regulator [Acetatifactor sp.]